VKASGYANIKENNVSSEKKNGFLSIFQLLEIRILVPVLFSCLLIFSCSTSNSLTTRMLDNSTGKHSLKEVAVFVELEKPSDCSQEIDRNQIQKDIETKIRQAGIKVLPQKQPNYSSGVPIVYLNIIIVKFEKQYAYNADIIFINNSTKQELVSGKANRGTTGLVSEVTQVRQKVAELVNRFIINCLS
jgi:hypothetical protein